MVNQIFIFVLTVIQLRTAFGAGFTVPTAIPVVFPSVKIKGLAGEFIDGGTGRDGIPVEAIAAERCKELFIISRMRGEYRKRQGFSLGKRRIEKVPRTIDSALFALELLMDSLFV